MTNDIADMLPDFDQASPPARPLCSEPRFKKLASLRSYAESGTAPLVDAPAWDPDDDASRPSSFFG
ncbi:hypothetical protein [Parvularcula lutaonensis]|uniref:Uncharacterized protein n=1 Tax=Parvularcula lutaonensis TaxID=491923 RepID=A0ABV7M7B7_9PROT|nr:hypothetical protein [Parvularcula lutaonensis]GGY41393.1 hypothetical protein GCM10007148_07480 [Parvularcula lutaonensis]